MKIKDKYINEAIGYIVLHQHENKLKQLTNTDIKYLKRFFGNLYINKEKENDDFWKNGNSYYHILRKSNIKCYATYIGNRWASWCNINKKTGLFVIDSADYGQENPCVMICDLYLENITKNMYEQLEDKDK